MANFTDRKYGSKDQKPNVLFLFTDDQRFDTINALGNDDVKTPNMDRLVEEGVSFTHSHIMGGSHAAVCMPSRAMMLTGRNLFGIAGDGEKIPPEHETIPQTFRKNGYEAYGTGKWHNGTESYTRSFSKGSNIFFGGMDDHWNVPVCDYHPDGKYPNPEPDRFDTGTGEMMTIDKIYERHESGKHSTELFVDGTLDFLSEYGDNPFFAYVSFMAPHDPRNMPRKYLEMYDYRDLELPDSFLPRHPFDNGELLVRDEKLANWPRNPREIKRHIADYYAMISHIDAEVGRLLDQLEDRDQLNNTIIVLAGDNGLALGRHGLMGKQNLYDHSIRVPLVFRGPGIPEGKETDTLCYLQDIFPTLCELTNITAPVTVQGRSLVPAMKEDSSGIRNGLLCAYKNLQRCIRSEDYKLIEYIVGNKRRTQLFNLEQDPEELRDLSKSPDKEDKIKELRQQMRSLQQEMTDPLADKI